MLTTIQKWGNGQGLHLNRQVLRDANLSVGDEVDVTAREGAIVIAPARRIRGRHSLRELVLRIPEGYKAIEIDWGKPVGKEAW